MDPRLKIIETKDGSFTVYTDAFKATYHSLNGALQESKHVFIENGLKLSAGNSPSLNVLEVGFGTGLNAYLTLNEGNAQRIYYHAIEKFPLSEDIYLQLDQDPFFQHLHRSDWEKDIELSPQFTLHKTKADIKDLFLEQKYTLIYFDAFAPNHQSELWEKEVLQKLYNCLLPGGILVTYCAKGEFKRTLRSIGFTIESPKGALGKREMTRATRPF